MSSFTFSKSDSRSDWKAAVFSIETPTGVVNVIEIVDLDLGNMSVTNDMEGVILALDLELERLHGGEVSIGDIAVIYLDTEQIWDEVVLDDVGNFKKFAALPRGRCQTENRGEAVLRLQHRKLGVGT